MTQFECLTVVLTWISGVFVIIGGDMQFSLILI